jgi:hypothetical protein
MRTDTVKKAEEYGCLYISNQMKYISRTHLNLNYENTIESVFIELVG